MLIVDKKYEGKYVALESFTNNRVVASGKDPLRVMNAAGKTGVKEPAIIFIPKENMTYIY
jgi:hypothetical protein